MAVDFPKKAFHGGTGKRQQEKTNRSILDFSASVNPFPPVFDWHCDPATLEAYPDDSYSALKEKIGEIFHRSPEEICVGNGSIELIRVFCSVEMGCHGTRRTFSAPQPTFGEYSLSACLAGGIPVDDPANADIHFLCNPNNPTGALLGREAILEQLDKAKKTGSVLFCDEAFIELADPSASIAGTRDPSLFVLRSLTKCFSVPGIRFGYGFGDPDLIARIETARSPWSVNAYAEAYALRALDHLDDLARSRELIGRERDWLMGELASLGFACRQSSANYILAETGRDAAGFYKKLADRGILVRDCTSFNLPTSIRVAVRTRTENERLTGALAACLR